MENFQAGDRRIPDLHRIRLFLAIGCFVSTYWLLIGSVAYAESTATPSATAKSSNAPSSASGQIQEVRFFWEDQPAVEKKLMREREIPVQVHSKDVEKDIEFNMEAGGMVSAPLRFTFQTAQQYDQLQKVSGHFKKVQYNPEEKKLFLQLEALGYQARMLLQLRTVDAPQRAQMHWEVIAGHFQGMTGIIDFKDHELQKTRMALRARYQAKALPLPKALMGFALEVITQKVAEKMRVYIEGAYQAELKNQKKPKRKSP